MRYKPNYCSHCGEKVERDRWRLWTSSRFCENCEGALQKEDWLPRIFLAVAGIGGLFGFGSYLKSPQKSVNLTETQIIASASNKIQNRKNESGAVNSNIANLTAKPGVQANSGLQNQSRAVLTKKENSPSIGVENTQIVESEPVYFCGAQTKKGTPCTRKMKRGGRCWQHEGLPAMLPKEKLASSQ